MIKGKNIICISSIDWDFIWQGHQEIMSVLAANGNRVFFIENTGVRAPGIRDIPRIKNRFKNWFKGIKGIRKEGDNLYIFSPLVIPYPYLRVARWINRYLILSVVEKWMKIANFHDPVIWTFLPTPLSLDIINNLSKKAVIYYSIDNFKVSSYSAKKIQRYEIELLKKADLVFVTSRALYNYCSSYNSRVYMFPFAVNFQEFERVRHEKDSAPEELRNIKGPIIGYVGGIHRWIDQELIKEAAEKYSEYSFIFIGPIQTDISLLCGIKNIYFLGKKSHVEIPYFIKHFGVCIIPYLITEYTKNVYPTKLNEYHAMGKPVISTDLPEIANFNAENHNLVFVSPTKEGFAGCIASAFNSRNEYSDNKRIESAKNNSWLIRIQKMSDLLEETIGRKISNQSEWQEEFLKFYKIARRKMFTLILTALSIYLLIFYTPLLWFLASPLKFSQMPQKADCIVVFAGGAGESGKAGEGYEERVGYAVELYKKGYADNIIFSSGYINVFHEPLVMKALAKDLGVPGEAIILENKARNTYENVKFSKKILDKMSWNKILLVSTGYHMRRVSLVFNKIAKDIKVIYVPIKNSLFYSHPDKDMLGRRIWKRINIQQIKGIFHEYLGIIYYSLKGYI